MCWPGWRRSHSSAVTWGTIGASTSSRLSTANFTDARSVPAWTCWYRTLVNSMHAATAVLYDQRS